MSAARGIHVAYRYRKASAIDKQSNILIMRHLKLFAAAAGIFLCSNCAKNPVTGNRQLVLMSEAQEIEMGKAADPEIIQQYGLYPDSALQQFITAKGRQMAATSHRPNIEYHFRIVDSDILNAFAVPGGMCISPGV